MSHDTKILELALASAYKALDALIGECLDESGKPKPPSTKAIMRARAYLPAKYPNAIMGGR